MPATEAASVISLDVTTLFVVASSITGLLGLFLLFNWSQDRIRALGLWGAAYVLAAVSIALWAAQGFASVVPASLPHALLLLACGMIWAAARVFHGRDLLWTPTLAGATAWLLAFVVPGFDQSIEQRIIVSSIIISTYVFLTACELWRERRKDQTHRWTATLVPISHGFVFLLPIPFIGLLSQHGTTALTNSWIGIFLLQMMLYAVSMAFVILVLAKEQVVRVHRTAASTDSLTGLLNRRALCDGAQHLFSQQARKGEPISVLIFDLDHFKSINDSHGHALGDDTLKKFADTMSANMRASDLFGRLGGEEFAAVIPATLAEAVCIAERVRCAFEVGGEVVAGQRIDATVSVGAASGHPARGFDALLARADAALYRAKADGRNRTETMEAGPAFGVGSFTSPTGASSLTRTVRPTTA
jgi:diguanylate cyclase (GGDEF)-like protein